MRPISPHLWARTQFTKVTGNMKLGQKFSSGLFKEKSSWPRGKEEFPQLTDRSPALNAESYSFSDLIHFNERWGHMLKHRWKIKMDKGLYPQCPRRIMQRMYLVAGGLSSQTDPQFAFYYPSNDFQIKLDWNLPSLYLADCLKEIIYHHMLASFFSQSHLVKKPASQMSLWK